MLEPFLVTCPKHLEIKGSPLGTFTSGSKRRKTERLKGRLPPHPCHEKEPDVFVLSFFFGVLEDDHVPVEETQVTDISFTYVSWWFLLTGDRIQKVRFRVKRAGGQSTFGSSTPLGISNSFLGGSVSCRVSGFSVAFCSPAKSLTFSGSH